MNGRQQKTTAQGAAAFGAELQRWRDQRGLSLAELQKLTTFSRSHLGNVEHGQRQPTEQLAKACDQALETGGALLRMFAALPREQVHRVRPAQLPARGRHFVGRDDLVVRMSAEIDQGALRGIMPVICLDGPAGVGKTALAIQWAHVVAERFPDGILFTNLRGHDASNQPAIPSEVLRDFLVALGVGPLAIPPGVDQRIGQYRSLLAGKRMMVVLDNAVTAEQVRPLLPGSDGCLALVTSRNRLTGLSTRDDATRMSVGPLNAAESASLLTDVIGRRAHNEPEATRDLAQLCAGFPLALRIAAERANDRDHLALARLAGMLTSQTKRLEVLSVGGDDSAALRAAFSWSYNALAPQLATLFRLLSVHPGPEFSAAVAAAAANLDLAETQSRLDALAQTHLIEEIGEDRYRFHDLLHLYAAECAESDEPEPTRQAATERVLQWYLSAGQAAGRIISAGRGYAERNVPAMPTTPEFAGYDEAADWCETERVNLAKASQKAAELGLDDIAVGLPIVLCDYLYRRKPWGPWIRPHELALEICCASGNTTGYAFLVNNLGNAFLDLGRPWRALDSYRRALTIRRGTDDFGLAWTLIGMGRAYHALGELHHAADVFIQSEAMFTDLDVALGSAIAWSYVGEVCHDLGQHKTAREYLEVAVEQLRPLDRQAEGCALDKLALVCRHLDDLDRAIMHLERALAARTELGDRREQARTLDLLADLYIADNRTAHGRDALRRAVDAYRDVDDELRAAQAQQRLDSMRPAVSRGEHVDRTLRTGGR
ncbi:ATP-binding protein [Actinokineospora sp. HUAS TT18]|uniref:ATP-binding protein n=1 Tax=Actinokineospora sp. HUAS TT18 TaxID=3447451 RepID=UPI003F528B1C